MKVLFLPHDRLSRGQRDGLNHAFGPWNVDSYDYLEKLRAGEVAIERDFIEWVGHYQPELVWMNLQDAGVITAEVVEAARARAPKTRFVQWIGDYHPVISPRIASTAKACNTTLVSSAGQIRDFFRAGARDVLYCQVAVDWTNDVHGWPSWTPPFRVPDVVFVGNCYLDGPWSKGTEERLGAVRVLQDLGVDFGVIGSGWPKGVPVIGMCTVDQQASVYRLAKVVINVNHANDVERYYSDRMLIGMASGTPVVARHVPGLDAEFDRGTDLFWYETDDELRAAVRFLLDPLNSGLAQIGRASCWERV